MGLYLIAAQSFWGNPNSYLAMAMVGLGLGTVIFVHELGHFLVAKACGVKCEKFYVGFDFFDIKIAGRVIIPRSLFKFQWGETEYGIGIIPLGGYVKMLGQDDDPTKYSDELERSKAQSDDGGSKETESGKDDGEKTAIAEPTDQPAELDPRSYQAKTVPQRMAIISAGVIMNLIFAVIFATIAYRLGVRYESCEVGRLTPGGPAWKAGLMPGDKILQIGKSGEPNEYLRHLQDLSQEVALSNGKELDFLVRRARTQDTDWISIQPKKLFDDQRFPMIGVGAVRTNQLISEDFVVEGTPAADANPPFKGNDKIVAINGEPINDFFDLRAAAIRQPDRVLTFTVARAAESDESSEAKSNPTKVDIEVAPWPVRHLGLIMEMGPILGIQPGSPADGKLQEKDIIRKLNGEAIDPMRLPTTLLMWMRDQDSESAEITLEVERKEKTVTVTLTPRLPTESFAGDYLGVPMLSDELGIAYEVRNIVRAVQPNSPAQEVGIKPGDMIRKVEFLAASKEKKEAEKKRTRLEEAVEVSEAKQCWPSIHLAMQAALEDTRIEVTYQRKNKEGKYKQEPLAKMTPVSSKDWFSSRRGIVPKADSQLHVAESWGEAFRLGRRETWESSIRVIGFLKKLINREVSPTNLGGPGTIAVVATSEATQGPARLLIFLTLLSANLAVVNFLPIPVLDGGHMMFLTYELVTRRRPSEVWFIRLSVAGLAFILSLMLFVIGMDVFRFAEIWSG